ncbi:MAG: hypothetical protein N2511_05125 [Thermodesulfovibrionales bacterium]|nr:hypothetical protein [Thermodesulfovibrionales bacterium]
MKGKIFYLKRFMRILILAVFSLIIIDLSLFNNSFSSEKSQKVQSFQYSKNPELQQIKPKKPVKIKLKRSAKGEYSWELSGDNVDDIVKADKRLRKLLETE